LGPPGVAATYAVAVADALSPPKSGVEDWVGLSGSALPVNDAVAWAVIPRCGGVVAFVGTVRDHADGREGVKALEYEAYEGPATDRLAALASEARQRWPGVGRVAMLHRVGRLDLEEPAVVVVVSAPHRDEAFEAAKWCIDTLKATVPIWKKEEWEGGTGWGTDAQPVADVPGPPSTLRSA
jgi:molybdopterin synthase catalytic subunit